MRKSLKRGLAVVLSSTLLFGSTVFCQAAGGIYQYDRSAIGQAVMVAEGNIGRYTARLAGSNAGGVTLAKVSVGSNNKTTNILSTRKLPAYSNTYTDRVFYTAKGINSVCLYNGTTMVLRVKDAS